MERRGLRYDKERLGAEVEIAERCQLIGTLSAQYKVFLLPHEYDYDIYERDDEDAYDEPTEVQRVFKIPLNRQERACTLELMGINDSKMQDDKIDELVMAARLNTKSMIMLANKSEYLYRLMGMPRFVGLPLESGRNTIPSYTQDLARPFSDIFAGMDMENEEDFRAACSIVDDFIECQLCLFAEGYSDPTFKILDNYGHNTAGVLRLLDAGELNDSLEVLLENIRRKEWLKIGIRPEFTKLPPLVQQYLFDALESRLTEETVRATWKKNSDTQPDGPAPLELYEREVSETLEDILGTWWRPEVKAIARQYIPLLERRNVVSIAQRCERIGVKSAQFDVFRLPREYNYDASPTGQFYDTIEVGRVMKVSHQERETLAAIERMNIIGQAAKMDKMADLMEKTRTATLHGIAQVARCDELDRLFGHPLFVSMDRYNNDIGTISPIAYTQDYVRPMEHVLESLDVDNNPADFAAACGYIDDYINAQLVLCSYGLFDTIFKFVDNCGESMEGKLYIDRSEAFRMFDFSELESDLAVVLACVTAKKWRDIVHSSEYTQLSPSLQEYFSDVCEKRLTVEVIRCIWNTGFVDHQRSRDYGNLFDRDIPNELPITLKTQLLASR